MITNEGTRNVDDIARKVEQHRQERAELNDGHCRRSLLGLKRTSHSVVETNGTRREDEMRR